MKTDRKNKPSTNTDILLGEIKGTVKGIDDKLKEQNGAINSMRESVNGLSNRIDSLPCDIHAERISNIVTTTTQITEKASEQERDKKQGRRELLIALIAALLTGGFTVLGIWISQGCPLP